MTRLRVPLRWLLAEYRRTKACGRWTYALRTYGEGSPQESAAWERFWAVV